MKEIKFRAFICGEMHFFDLFDLFGGELDNGIHLPSDEEIMQFTGLTDKNGVEIYCGDIIESYHCTDGLGVHHFINHIVQWSDKFNGWFALNAESKSDNDGSIQLWCHTKANKYSLSVIGNIHQNTELLNEK